MGKNEGRSTLRMEQDDAVENRKSVANLITPPHRVKLVWWRLLLATCKITSLSVFFAIEFIAIDQ
jgi:hypothetical protein